MSYLLDVNVLIALIDRAHVWHEEAFSWFAQARQGPWATCPIVQNGFVRITSGAGYTPTLGSPEEVGHLLKDLLQQPNHEFWADDLSLVQSDLVEMSQVTSHRQTTDVYLLALAVSRGGKLATLDRKLPVSAVKGGAQALELISDPAH